mmetsp:Transcript_23797/g.38210  ORF Transcript_23797/g.38210 Transcript_23797/m.38210 type:complete len:433 (+) Transcript_23797:61-1359(+)
MKTTLSFRSSAKSRKQKPEPAVMKTTLSFRGASMSSSKSRGRTKKPLTICMIGATGVGKSSAANCIANIKKDSRNAFKASPEVKSCTYKTAVKKCRWFDDRQPMYLVDTPGLGDSEGRDSRHIAEMAKALKEHGEVHLFVIVFNGEDARMNEHTKGMIGIFSEMFGPEFLQNAALLFTHWPMDKYSIRRRRRSGLTKENRHFEFNKKFQEIFGSTRDLPSFFLDCEYDRCDEEEARPYKEEILKVKELAEAMDPFACLDVKNVLSLKDRAEKLAEDFKNKLKISKAKAAESAKKHEKDIEEERKARRRALIKAEKEKRAALQKAKEERRAALKKAEEDKDRAIKKQEEEHRKELEREQNRRKSCNSGGIDPMMLMAMMGGGLAGGLGGGGFGGGGFGGRGFGGGGGGGGGRRCLDGSRDMRCKEHRGFSKWS